MRRFAYLTLVLIAIALRPRCGSAPVPLRVATFNIENYPKSERQEKGAFALLRSLGLHAVALQEITEPERLERAARRHLGRSWRFAWPREGPKHRTGVLFDDRVLQLASTRVHHETELPDGGKPTFEARLRPRSGGSGVTAAIVRILVVHLKAGGEGIELRRRQLRALRPVLGAAVASGERVVLLGDFNATSGDDRVEIAALARAARMTWASDKLKCTSYWNRNDGCVGSALDHVLSSSPPRAVAARGPCETEGCDRRDRCPVFHEEVSDHCPVTLELGAEPPGCGGFLRRKFPLFPSQRPCQNGVPPRFR